MRKRLIAGNWKMHLTPPEAAAYAEQLLRHIPDLDHQDVAVCPAFPALGAVSSVLSGTHIGLGAQNLFWKEQGAYTGQVSPSMIVSCGCRYVILGHSETRGRFGKTDSEDDLAYFAESDATINRKIKAALPHGLTPILCVGETLSERESVKTDEVIANQLEGALAGIDGEELYGLVVAYEPVWAIGTGQACEPDEAERICGQIRAKLADMLGTECAESCRTLYGGSVNGANAGSYLKLPSVDGALVGGASLKSEEFARIAIS
ncbi:MAG: triose-phosphate isomerase [Armatimonadetes bacterium]|nr:triose-phosphate isomerase [Armatimonadota bacterium]